MRLHPKESFLRCMFYAVIALASWGPAQVFAASPETGPLFYGIHVGRHTGFWVEAEEGAVDACKKFGCRIIYRGGAEDDTQTQKAIFADAMASGAKGIFIAPNTAERSADVDAANAKHIPVVYFDRLLGSPKIVSFIGTNNYQAGVDAAEALITAMDGQANVAVTVFRMDKSLITTSERERGFIERVKKQGYQVIATPYIGSNIADGRKNIMAFLKTPEAAKTQAIFTPNETTSMAALLTFQMANKTASYKWFGFDSNPEIEKAIREGTMLGTVVQQPYRMGYYSVQALESALHGETPKAFIESGAMVVTRNNLDSYQTMTHQIQ